MKFYTYVLIDSRNDKIFYVGMGQKRRMYAHVNEVQRGRIEAKKGKRWSNETKLKIKMAMKILPEEIKLKMSKNKGKRFSNEHKRKLSESHKGNTSGCGNRGNILSEEHKKKKFQILLKDVNGHLIHEKKCLNLKNSKGGKGYEDISKKIRGRAVISRIFGHVVCTEFVCKRRVQTQIL